MENTNTINTTTTALPKDITAKILEIEKRDYDPILDDPLSDGSNNDNDSKESSGDDDDEESDEGVQIEFPR